MDEMFALSNPESESHLDREFTAEFGSLLGPISKEDIDPLKRQYAALILQLDRLRPKLAAANVLAREAPEPWSIKEVLGHIIDTDRDIWWPRIETIRMEEQPYFEDVDQLHLASSHRWHDLALEDIVSQLMRVRWNFAMKLNAISECDFERTGIHATLGEISILKILQLLVAHDAHYVERIRVMIETPLAGA